MVLASSRDPTHSISMEPDDNDTVLEEFGQGRHKQLLGRLLWFVTSKMQFVNCPLTSAQPQLVMKSASISLLRCVIGNPACKMFVSCNLDVLGIAGISHGLFVVMTDADWAGDVKDRRSYFEIGVWDQPFC